MPRRAPGTRRLMLLVALVALALGGWRAIEMNHQAHLCRSWARDYSARPEALERAAREPGIPPAEAAECRRHADIQRRIGRRYEQVAARPWLPWPKYPLLPELAQPPTPASD